jgi:hypothetical protein
VRASAAHSKTSSRNRTRQNGATLVVCTLFVLASFLLGSAPARLRKSKPKAFDSPPRRASSIA